ncbi:hypothetical protein KCU76_g77, partial [Aureobasidium melanogenum]
MTTTESKKNDALSQSTPPRYPHSLRHHMPRTPLSTNCLSFYSASPGLCTTYRDTAQHQKQNLGICHHIHKDISIYQTSNARLLI